MLRTALGLTSILLLTACSGNAPSPYNASNKAFPNSKHHRSSNILATSSIQGDMGYDDVAYNVSLPQPKFKPMWLSLAQNRTEVPHAEIPSLEDRVQTHVFEEEAPVAETVAEDAPAHADRAEERSVSMASAKVGDSELDKNRGTFSPEQLNSTVLEANATQNVSVNSVTGNNIVNSSAFSSAAGLVNVIQNSGNNVVIQSSTVVNLTFQ